MGDPSGTPITMGGVDFAVKGVDNLGNEKIMYPEEEHHFPGSMVYETPLRGAQQGIEVMSTIPGGTIVWDNMTEEERKQMQEDMDSLRGDIKSLTDSIGVLAEDAKKRNSADDNHKAAEQIRRDAIEKKHLSVKAERDRISEIDLMDAKMSDSTGIDFEDIRSECIGDGVSVADTRKRYMDRISTAKSTDFSDGMRIGVTKDERDKSREGAVDGLLIRSGVATADVQDKDTEFQTMSLLELAKNRLRCANESTRGMDQMQIFERALSTSDFDNILSDVANKALNEGFANADETYSQWCDTSGRVNDFKTLEFSRASEAPSFIEVNPDGGEYEYGSMSDAKESVAVADYGIIVPFTRAAMVNDDLGALSDIREKLGAAAARKYGDLVYAVLSGNPTMGDSVALFDVNTHGNYVTSGAAPSTTTLNAGNTAMATQSDIGGIQNLNIMPQFLLAPWALKGTVDALLHSTAPVVVGAETVNPWAYLTSIFDARLDTFNSSGWFMMARKGMTVKLFTLNGNMTPVIESKAGWSVDGMEFKSRITAAAKAVDYRGAYYNDGVT
jgi:hypothetical protein